MIPYARKQRFMRVLSFDNLYHARLYHDFWEDKSLVLHHVVILLSAFTNGCTRRGICTAIACCSFHRSVHVYGDFEIQFARFLHFIFGWFYF